MFTVLFIEDHDGDVAKAIKRVRASGITPLDLHVILLVDNASEFESELLRTELKVSSLYPISKNMLTYERLRGDTIEVARAVEPDIVVVDLHLLLHDSMLQLCDLRGPKAGENVLEGIQLTRDLEQTGLVSWFVWLSNHLDLAMSADHSKNAG